MPGNNIKVINKKDSHSRLAAPFELLTDWSDIAISLS